MSKSQRRVRFEEAMARLESIVDAVEKGDIGLEESIDKYEEAMGLVRQCRAILADAEQRIQRIQLDAQGGAALVDAPELADNAGAETQ